MSEKDNIKDLFRSKLDDYTVPAPPDGWQRIEESLAATSQMRLVRRRWRMSAAAVAAALITGGLLFIYTPKSIDAPVLTEHAAQQQLPAAEKPSAETAQTAPATNSIIRKAERLVTKITHLSHKKKNRRAQPSVLVASAFGEKKVLLAPEKVIGVELELAEEKINGNVPEMTDEERERLIQEFANQGNRNESYLNLGGSQNDKPFTLALGGRGGLTSSQRTVNMPMTLRSAKTTIEKSDALPERMFGVASNEIANTDRSTTGNISEMIHSQPVSFGFGVSKSITDRISLETGLVYTYLNSKAKNTSNEFKSEETQQLHYLGIPLNVNYNVLSMKKLDMYVSLGGMVEKDVYGKYEYVDNTVQEELNSASEKKVSVNIRQKNPQLSVNAGVGVSYPLYNNLKIYGKIGGSYYFDAKNEYKTFYSDQKIVLDVNLGLRIDF